LRFGDRQWGERRRQPVGSRHLVRQFAQDLASEQIAAEQRALSDHLVDQVDLLGAQHAPPHRQIVGQIGDGTIGFAVDKQQRNLGVQQPLGLQHQRPRQ
jgi:hypothetical protein